MGFIGLKIPCRDLPGKDFLLFYIAPLNPVLKDEAFGEQAGQTFAFAGLHLLIGSKLTSLNCKNSG